MSKPKLSKADTPRIIERRQRGDTPSAIARDLGVTTQCISQKLLRLGVTYPPEAITKSATWARINDTIGRIQDLLAEGVAPKEMPRKLNLDKRSVRAAMRQGEALGRLPSLRQRFVFTKERWEEANRRYHAGESVASIEKSMGMRHNTLTVRIMRERKEPGGVERWPLRQPTATAKGE